MTYRIIFAPSFSSDVDALIGYWQSQQVAADTVQGWFTGLLRAIDHLEDMPRMYPVDEHETGAVGRETRKLVHGDYLVFYQVDDDARRVNIVALAHGATRKDG